MTDFSQKSGQSAGFYRYPGEVSNVAATYSSQALSIYPNGFLPKINTVIQDYSLSAGLTGKLGKWNTSLSNTLGINVFDVKVDNSIDYTEQAFVVHPQQQFYAGGTHNLQNTINLDLSRNFNVLSGLNIAYGAETRLDQYKQEKGNIASFQNYDTTSGSIGGVQSFPGFTPNYSHLHNRSSSAVYLDVEQDFSKNILVDFALRYQKYSDFGEALTYKIGSKYKITDRFEVNGSTSTAFRPPSLQQQFYSKTSSLFLPCFGGGIPTEVATLTNDSRAAQILGIPPLIGEMANSFSLGFMASPSNWLDISVNGYLTAIKNRIVLTSNFNGTNNTELAQILSNNAATQVNFFSNAIDTRSKGIEAVLNYHTIFGNLNRLRFSLSAAYNQNEVVKAADGKPLLKTSPTLISSMQLNNYFNREEQSRIEVASPKLKGNFAAYFTHKTLVIMVRINYFGQVRYISPIINPQAPSTFPYNTFTGLQQTTDQTFKAKTVTDLSLSFNINKSFTLNFGVNNVFDTYPDKQLHSENVAMGRFIYNPHVQQMGSNGRYVFGRIAFNIKNI